MTASSRRRARGADSAKRGASAGRDGAYDLGGERGHVRRARPSRLASSIPAVMLGLALAAPPARADDSADDRRRAFKLLRDDENWAWLRAPHPTRDVFDPIKYLRLSHQRDDLYLSIGGEARQWVEAYQNELWGSTGFVDNVYWLQRYMLHAELRLTRYVRVFVQLKSGIEVGRLGGPRPIDEDYLDANQAYFDIDALPAATLDGTPRLTIRIGRQELSYGSGRLIDVREGPNVRFGLDGVRLRSHVGPLRLDAFVVRPDLTKRGVFDDGWDTSQLFWGAWATVDIPRLLVDAYYLGLDRAHAVYEQGMGHELRHTVGARLVLRIAGSLLRLEAEGAYQFGRFLDGDISAWTAATSAVVTLERVRLRPQITAGAGVTSGDRDPNDRELNTFSPLFPTGSYFGLIGANGPSNNIGAHLAVALKLPKSVSVIVESWVFFRESLGDGVYNVPGYLLRRGAGNPARYLGAQLAPFVAWDIDRHLSLHGTVAYFWAGDFFRMSSPGQNTTYGALWATYKF